eukprot:NODE_6763_length_1641_cov_2.940555.p1 GENE.NODE_6763_length_1641_cov_2.940555~~NODE_6763_length_1641_cov_2.940555.p1  ORF type:complete len:479 (+),score=148.43 NODE_6763_length_1641_cov_2.940555:107-1438(+)
MSSCASYSVAAWPSDRDVHGKASRIADMLRSQEPWPQAGPLDLAQRLVDQHRRKLDGGLASLRGEAVMPAAVPLPTACGSVDAMSLVNQLAERFAGLLAAQQRHCDERQELTRHLEEDLRRELTEMGRRLQQNGSHAETRHQHLEARIALCEERCNSDAFALDTVKVLREARAVVNSVVAKAETQWSLQRSELRSNQVEHTQQLDQLFEQTRSGTQRLSQIDQTLASHARSIRNAHSELVHEKRAPQWFEDLEASIAAQEHNVAEQRSASELQMRRLCTDLDALRLRLGGLHDEIQGVVDRRLQDEARRRVTPLRPALNSSDMGARLDELEIGFASLRAEVDSHAGHLCHLDGVPEQFEASIESARQAVLQQCDAIMSGVEGQVCVLREHIQALSELVQELSEQQLKTARSSGEDADLSSTDIETGRFRPHAGDISPGGGPEW